MSARVKKWCGSRPTKCDLCFKELIGVFIDGKTDEGPWGILCLPCHQTQGIGVGEGRGQVYDLKTLKKLEG